MTGDASIINAKFFWYLLFINLLVDIYNYYQKPVWDKYQYLIQVYFQLLLIQLTFLFKPI